MRLRRQRPITVILAAAACLLALQLPAFVGVAAEPLFASDAFGRSQSNGWGAADVGGSYTVENWPTNFSVSAGTGNIVLPAAGANRAVKLQGVSAHNVDLKVRVKTDKRAVGSSFYVYFIARGNANNAYRPKAIFQPNGSVAVHGGVLVNNVESSIAPPVTVGGLSHTAGGFIWVRSEVVGANPTTVRVKAWADGAAEPAGWQFSATNSSGSLQGAGTVGLRSYVSSITNAPITFSFDDFVVGTGIDPSGTPSASPTATPTQAPTASASPSPTPAATVTPTPVPTATPTPPPGGPTTIGLDTFTRTASDSWGAAQTGGPYSYFGTQADFDVNTGKGLQRLPTAGSTRIAFLPGAWGRDVDVTFSFTADKSATGSGLYVYGVLRGVADGSSYRPKLRIEANGEVYAHVGRQSPSSETSLGTALRVPGVTFTPGQVLHFRAQATGSGPTTIRVRAWIAGQSEPSAWHFTATDSTAALQQAGSVRLMSYLSSNATNAPLIVSFDDFAATTTDPPPVTGNVIIGAGDIASCSANTDQATSLLLDSVAGTVFTLGDSVYPNGTTSEYANCYGPTWGRHVSRTKPVIGNHEYQTPQAAPYFAYFGPAAGEPAKGWYAYDVGTWRIYALNSNCGIVSCVAGATQEQWLRADLAANSRQCVIAMWHHPRFSSGDHGDAQSVQPFWQALSDAGAEIVLSGHDHNYERFAPLNASGALDAGNGIRSFVVGTGGIGLRALEGIRQHSQVSQADTHGVLKLTLGAGAYEWEFIPVAGRTFTDRGTGTCHS